MDDVPTQTLEVIRQGLNDLNTRIEALENAPAGSSEKSVRVLKHMYDWLQHFGMPGLPSQEPKPEPVRQPAAPQPEGFDPFAPAR